MEGVYVLNESAFEQIGWINDSDSLIKGLVHPKMKIMSLITHPHVIPNP